MKMTVGRFLEQGIEDGTIAENQPVFFYGKNNNIYWVGKAAYAPYYFGHIELQSHQIVGNELRINQRTEAV